MIVHFWISRIKAFKKIKKNFFGISGKKGKDLRFHCWDFNMSSLMVMGYILKKDFSNTTPLFLL